MCRLKTRWTFLAAVAVSAAIVLSVYAVVVCPPPGNEPELVVRVSEVRPVKPNTWLVPAAAVAGGAEGRHVIRLNYLRAQRVPVEVVGRRAGDLVVRGGRLKAGDLVVVPPANVPPRSALAPEGGVSHERLIGLVLEAGLRAARAKNLAESLRFISPGYRDQWGFNRRLLGAMLKTAFQRFDSPRIDLASPPLIEVQGDRARVRLAMRLTAVYAGRRNYLLGDDRAPNQVMVELSRTDKGWKISRVSGLRPLGFEPKFLRMLGAEVGVALSRAEKMRRRTDCMRCKRRMEKRFLGQ
ncbi:MAG: nuclear transport factor 2 family protein [Proteobacteria bacterium]|nr:nuclear transport factor 2 family protein [Pseudomonadota bacterium]MBU1742899.1 nuclear transport factor 2 family protein [Pseudomonadota bacterium]